MTSANAVGTRVQARRDGGRRTLGVAAGAHILHDGFTDLLYVLLPVWQAQFGLGYAEVGVLRALYAGTMAGLQIPAGMLSGRFGVALVLALGTALAGAGYLIAGIGGGFVVLAVALAIGGAGSSTQHPLGSALVAQAYEGRRSRVALGTYNFSGDIGKMIFPAATAWLLTFMPWRSAVMVLGAIGLIAAAAILVLLRRSGGGAAPVDVEAAVPAPAARAPSRRSFVVLQSIGMIDSATRMGFLTFLPFLLTMKGADLPLIGMALTLVFAGGAGGKLACGYLGARFGVLATVFVTEGATALAIMLLVALPLEAALVLLPVIGVALNGTSSVLYGTVPEFVTPERRAHAFGVFYTSTIGAGAVAPILFGLFGDAVDVGTMMVAIAALVLLTLPLGWLLRPALRTIDA